MKLNRWERRELKRKFGITFATLMTMSFGGLMLAMKTNPLTTMTTPHALGVLGGVIAGLSGFALIHVLSQVDNPRVYECVKGGIILNEDTHNRIKKKRAKWVKENL